jgi:hypothetical protein
MPIIVKLKPPFAYKGGANPKPGRLQNSATTFLILMFKAYQFAQVCRNSNMNASWVKIDLRHKTQ